MMKLLKSHLIVRLVFPFLGLLFLLSQCANPVMPLGGIKDEIPPNVVGSEPENFSVNFKGNTIIIEFDEFVKLDKINQQALISPPLKTNPEYKIKGKSVIIKFDEELKSETTYTLFFGNSIVDLTESNPLEAYTFVFSTGSVLDSMSLAGNAKYAFDSKPGEASYILLYRLENDTVPIDSLPLLARPYYVSKADKKGNFRFQNLRNEPYIIYALEDKNNNFLYDKGNEAIGFLDKNIEPEYLKSRHRGKLKAIETDSLAVADTVKSVKGLHAVKVREDSISFSKLRMHQMYLFYEIDSTQRLIRTEVEKPGLLKFVFRYPAPTIVVEPMSPLPDNFGLLKQFTKNKDTLLWYFRDKIIDSLQVSIKLDTLIDDTLQLSLNKRAAIVSDRKPKEEAVTGSKLGITTKVQGRRLDIGEKLTLNFSEPIVQYQMRDSSRFISKEDTIYNQIIFEKYDSIGLKYLFKTADFEAEGSYSLLFPDSVFFGLNGAVNDTVKISFSVPAVSDYGNLFLDIVIDENVPMIIQLLNLKEEVLNQYFLEGSQKLELKNMKPGKYKLKAIQDINRNRRWDTGNLIDKLQAESIYYYTKELEVRPNWDLEEEWDLSNTEEVNKE